MDIFWKGGRRTLGYDVPYRLSADVTVRWRSLRPGYVRFTFDAPREVRILREELLDARP